MDISDINHIKSKTDFIAFLGGLAENFRDRRGEWKNPTIDEFLEACASWVMDFSDCPQNDIDWNRIDYRTLAKILYMGKHYE